MVARTAARLAGAGLCLVLVAALPACSKEGPDKSLTAYLTGLRQGSVSGLSLLSESGQALSGDDAQKQLTGWEGDLATRKPDIKVNGKPKVKGDSASMAVNISWPIADGVTWTYPSTVTLKRVKDKWLGVLSASTVYPDLPSSGKLALRRTAAQRGTILDGAGQPLATSKPVVTVGVQPNKIKDLNGLIQQLDAAFKSVNVAVDLSGLPAKVQSSQPTAFIQIVTLRREVYDQIRAKIHDLEGTVFREGTQVLGPSTSFARALLGTVGEVTKEIMDKNPGKYQVGDVVGLSGLQRRYDDLLRGTPGATVVIPGTNNNADKILFTSDPKPGGTVKTTLDVKTETAAETALAGEARRSAIVAIRISDGAVLAAANGPTGAELNLALTAQVPPGSTFKMVTALTVLSKGAVGPDTVVPCPKNITVGGKQFKNAHDFQLGNVPFHTDFAKSCNTAFASLWDKMEPDGLATTGSTIGLGVPWDFGVDVFTGKVSSGGDPTERAAAAFGQGTTQVSPMSLAAAAAAVSRGQWKQPSFVVDPAPTKPAADGPQLDANALTALKNMMREVVTSGTASPLAKQPGAPIFGKTGTAEFDNNPDHTHSWFIGFRGDIAFAVFVENGGLSTATAVPIAGKFFTNLG
jgi:cell division protein FtsI/penicillin-binding protein 2